MDCNSATQNRPGGITTQCPRRARSAGILRYATAAPESADLPGGGIRACATFQDLLIVQRVEDGGRRARDGGQGNDIVPENVPPLTNDELVSGLNRPAAHHRVGTA